MRLPRKPALKTKIGMPFNVCFQSPNPAVQRLLLFNSVRFRCVQEVAAPSDPTQRFLQLQRDQGWAFDKAMAGRKVLMPLWNGKVFVGDVEQHSLGRAQASHFPPILSLQQPSKLMEMEHYHEPGMCKGGSLLEPWLLKRERGANLNCFC